MGPPLFALPCPIPPLFAFLPPSHARVLAEFGQHGSNLLGRPINISGPTFLPVSVQHLYLWCRCALWHDCDCAGEMQINCALNHLIKRKNNGIDFFWETTAVPFLFNATHPSEIVFLTWKPPSIDSPNQTCFFSGPEVVHQFFCGTLLGVALIQVSPVSILQYTFIASNLQPWLGSIQYSPTGTKHKDVVYVMSGHDYSFFITILGI